MKTHCSLSGGVHTFTLERRGQIGLENLSELRWRVFEMCIYWKKE